MPTKKKSKADPAVDAPPDPREALAPNAANFTAILAELKAVLADIPPPSPAESKSTESKAAEAKATEAKAGEGKAADGKAGDGKAGDGKAAEGKAAEGKAAEGQATEGRALPQLDLVDALLHYYFADGLACGYGQEARRRIAESYVDRNEFRVTEAFEVEDMLRDLPIPDLFDRCLAVRDSIAQIYNDQNGVSLAFLRDAGISERNTFFQRVPAVQPHVATFLANLLTIEELCFSDKSTLRAQQRLGIEPKDAVANKFLDEVRALLKPFGYLPLDVGPHLSGHKVNLKHTLSPACLMVRLAPPGKRRG